MLQNQWPTSTWVLIQVRFETGRGPQIFEVVVLAMIKELRRRRRRRLLLLLKSSKAFWCLRWSLKDLCLRSIFQPGGSKANGHDDFTDTPQFERLWQDTSIWAYPTRQMVIETYIGSLNAWFVTVKSGTCPCRAFRPKYLIWPSWQMAIETFITYEGTYCLLSLNMLCLHVTRGKQA